MKAGARLCAVVLGIAVAAAASGQAAAAQGPAPDPASVVGASSLALAISSEDYPVTPGDLYNLTYLQAGAPVGTSLLVQSDGTIDMGIFGTLGADGLSFAQLRPRVAAKVTAVYPGGIPSLSITRVGVFRVLIQGENLPPRYVQAGGLSLLSDVVAAAAAPGFSVRSVQVDSRSGARHTYDLMAARRAGKLTQDPYVRPGDVVTLSRAALTVEVSGEVRTPGRYQLLPQEDLGTLLNLYGGGFTARADTSRISVERSAGDSFRTLAIDLRADPGDPVALQDEDIVRVPSKAARQPVVYFEGAVVPPGSADQPVTASTALTNSVTFPFREGITLNDALAGIRASLSPRADLKQASLLRASSGESIPLDLQSALTGADPGPELQPFDRVVIPYSRLVVFLTGAVTGPGPYPYAPNRTARYYLGLGGASSAADAGTVSVADSHGTLRLPGELIQPEDTIYVTPAQVSVWGAVVAPGAVPFQEGHGAAYYISLAGGVDTEKSSRGAYTVTGADGKTKGPSDTIRAGDRIRVNDDSFLYNFNRYFPVIGATVGLIAGVATIIQVAITLGAR